MKIVYSLLIMTSVLVLGCSKEKFEKATWTISSQLGVCTGIGQPFPCMQIKEEGSTDWKNFGQSIEGFTYEAGVEYVVEVKIYNIENPPADASSKRYVLIRIISKQ
jgi:hypothetical protein